MGSHFSFAFPRVPACLPEPVLTRGLLDHESESALFAQLRLAENTGVTGIERGGERHRRVISPGRPAVRGERAPRFSGREEHTRRKLRERGSANVSQ